jgi:hypothetical protein
MEWWSIGLSTVVPMMVWGSLLGSATTSRRLQSESGNPDPQHSITPLRLPRVDHPTIECSVIPS